MSKHGYILDICHKIHYLRKYVCIQFYIWHMIVHMSVHNGITDICHICHQHMLKPCYICYVLTLPVRTWRWRWAHICRCHLLQGISYSRRCCVYTQALLVALFFMPWASTQILVISAYWCNVLVAEAKHRAIGAIDKVLALVQRCVAICCLGTVPDGADPCLSLSRPLLDAFATAWVCVKWRAWWPETFWCGMGSPYPVPPPLSPMHLSHLVLVRPAPGLWPGQGHIRPVCWLHQQQHFMQRLQCMCWTKS